MSDDPFDSSAEARVTEAVPRIQSALEQLDEEDRRIQELLDAEAKTLPDLLNRILGARAALLRHPAEDCGVRADTSEEQLAWLRNEIAGNYLLPTVRPLWLQAAKLNVAVLPAWTGEPQTTPDTIAFLDALAACLQKATATDPPTLKACIARCRHNISALKEMRFRLMEATDRGVAGEIVPLVVTFQNSFGTPQSSPVRFVYLTPDGRGSRWVFDALAQDYPGCSWDRVHAVVTKDPLTDVEQPHHLWATAPDGSGAPLLTREGRRKFVLALNCLIRYFSKTGKDAARRAVEANQAGSDPTEPRTAVAKPRRKTVEEANAEAMKLANKMRVGFFALSER